MKKSVLFAASLAVSALSATACGPGVPLCFFSGEEIGVLSETVLGELWLVGRHFYPDWAGTAPRGNDITSSEAHALDFAAAAARAGTADPAGDYERYRSAAEGWERAAWPDYARQFYLYALGRAQLLADATLSSPPAWRELLALPEADRKERTVWVLHGQVLAAEDFAAADSRLHALRAACDAGFTDTCGLEAAILRRLLLRDSDLGLRWLPLFLAAYGDTPHRPSAKPLLDVHGMLEIPHAFERATGLAERERALLGRVADEFAVWRRASWRDRNRRLGAALSADPVGREILCILDDGLDDPSPRDVPEESPLLSADRAAYRAFARGDFGTARALLRYAPADSLLRLFLEARFARMDGERRIAADLLRRWLEVFRESGGDAWCDFAVTGEGLDPREVPDEGLAWPRYVAGILGTVCVEEGDFVEALGVFAGDASSWLDAAFVAERCLSAGELAACLPDIEAALAERGNDPDFAGRLENLLARRYMRLGKPDEAGEWFARAAEETRKALAAHGGEFAGWQSEVRREHAEKPLAMWKVRQATAKRAYAETDPDKRAAAFVDLARIERAAGMELYGTELEPDVAVEAGQYGCSGVSFDSVRLPWWRIHDRERFPDTRWHWRKRAAETARRAAAMAAGEGVKAGALILAGTFVHADEAAANEAYRMLSDLPTHPAGAYAREKHWLPEWGGGPAAELVSRDGRRTPEEWLAGGWECTPAILSALAEETVR
ncbi:MAG: hypothetical protein IJS32_00695 [Kiritimatiellae bacterium]|nr:hypothetical protein [Kiritimatiellia bacterium]